MSDSEILTTYAIPESPRNKENLKKLENTVLNGKKTRNSTEENHGESSSESKTYKTSPNDPLEKGNNVNVAQYNYVQVTNCAGPVQIGTVNKYRINITNKANNNNNNNTTKKKKSPNTEILTEPIEKLISCDLPIKQKDLDTVAPFIGATYMQTFEKLGYRRGQIELQKLRFHDDIPGLVLELLTCWRQKNGKKEALVKVLANALWNTDQIDALQVWAEEYDKIHQK